MSNSNDLIDKFQSTVQNKTAKRKLFQCAISQDLMQRVLVQRKADKLSWRDLVESCFSLYLEISEKKDEKKPATEVAG